MSDGINLKLNTDLELQISIGRSRKETQWRAASMLWPEFIKKVSQTHRTAETYAEYLSSPKSRQDEIKDVGGFVGGSLSGGRRKNQNILSRCLLTLDIDNASDLSGWDGYKTRFGNAAVMYTTHKHSPDKPRYRLIIPLGRPVFSDEYPAIGRYVAGVLGIDQFDPTTFEAARLMFWPSTAKDAEFRFDYCDGLLMPADEILARYKDWRNIGEWAYGEKHREAVGREIKKQGSPLEKSGIIGAFCRSYSIAEALERFLPEEYAACDNDNRYTYTRGSTAAGLVVYDGVFAYSHHGTDPAGGKLCNAFDLVRLHKFGAKDDDAKPDTPVHKLPSFTAMLDFAGADAATKLTLLKEKHKAAQEDFKDAGDDDEDWQAELSVDRKGSLHQTIDNALLILTHDPGLKGRLAFNDFAKHEVALGDLPWKAVEGGERYLTDSDDAAIRHHLEKHYGLASAGKITDGMKMIMLKNTFHPVRQYLEGLVWDGVPRAETVFIDYLGAKDTEYTRVCTRTALVAAAARIFEPGVKFDNVLTLVGDQGIGKSTVIRRLGGAWYLDSLGQMQGREAYEQLQGVWIIELGELNSLSRSELSVVKHFISKQTDRFRVAYGKRVEDFARQCIFIGTTNKGDFLRDETGDRRWWPIDCVNPPKKPLDGLTPEEAGRIWAEAVVYYRQGHKLYLPREIEEAAQDAQQAHSEVDEHVGFIEEYLNTPLPAGWYNLEPYDKMNFLSGGDDERRKELMDAGTIMRDKVCVQEIWCELYRGDLKTLDARKARELRTALHKAEGWEAYDLSKGRGRLKFGFYGLQRAYVRKT